MTSKAAVVTVAKHVPTVTLKAKAGKKKGTATLDVTLKLPGKATKSTKATLKVYDGKKLLKQTVKIKNGKGKVTLTKLAAGRHPFTVVYAGDSTYNKATSKVASVGKDKPKLTVKAKAGKKGKATLTVTLKLPGTAAKSTKATLKVYDGKKLLKQTVKVKKGKGTVSLSKLKKGKHTFKVAYAGNSSYEAKSVTAKATIK